MVEIRTIEAIKAKVRELLEDFAGSKRSMVKEQNAFTFYTIGDGENSAAAKLVVADALHRSTEGKGVSAQAGAAWRPA
jgi:hypothetical protein